MNSTCFAGPEFSGSAKERPDTPLPNFAGINSATARPVPAGRSRRHMTSPRGPLRSAPAALARGLPRHDRACTGRRPVGLVPEQPPVATMRHHMVDHGRRHHAPLGPAGGAERVLRQEGGPCPAPARTVAPARCARPLPVQRPLHLRRAPEPRRTVHRRLRRATAAPHSKTRRGHAGRAVETHLRVYHQTISCEPHCQTTNDVSCSNSNLLQARQTRSSALLNRRRLCEPKADLGVQSHHGRV